MIPRYGQNSLGAIPGWLPGVDPGIIFSQAEKNSCKPIKHVIKYDPCSRTWSVGPTGYPARLPDVENEMRNIQMTLDKFVALISDAAEWKIESVRDPEINKNEIDDYDDEGNRVTITTCWTWGCVEAKHPCGIEITYQETASWPKGKPDEYESTTDHGADVLTITGATVVDEDGDELSSADVVDLFDEHAAAEFTDVDWPGMLPEREIEEVDVDSDAKEYLIERTNALDLKFTGELIASVYTSKNNASCRPGRWTTLDLYRTASGKFIAESVDYPIWEHEHERHSAELCATEADVIRFFGTGWLAKELYKKAGIDAPEMAD